MGDGGERGKSRGDECTSALRFFFFVVVVVVKEREKRREDD